MKMLVRLLCHHGLSGLDRNSSIVCTHEIQYTYHTHNWKRLEGTKRGNRKLLIFLTTICRPILEPRYSEVLFHENVAFAASTSLANGKWIVAGGITGNNSFYGGGECALEAHIQHAERRYTLDNVGRHVNYEILYAMVGRGIARGYLIKPL